MHNPVILWPQAHALFPAGQNANLQLALFTGDICRTRTDSDKKKVSSELI